MDDRFYVYGMYILLILKRQRIAHRKRFVSAGNGSSERDILG